METFTLLETPQEIEAALAEPSLDLEPPADIEVPEALITPDRLAQLIATQQPHFVPVVPGAESVLPPPDPTTGVLQRRLSNGVTINYKLSANEPRAATLRVVANGGRTSEVGILI